MFVVNIEDNDQLGDEITTLAGQVNATNYRFLKLIVDFDRREPWGGGELHPVLLGACASLHCASRRYDS
jgi:hypothetical protein